MYSDRIQKIFDQKELKIKMSLSVQRSVVEQFSFNSKKVQSVYIKGGDVSYQEMFTRQLDMMKKTVKKPSKI